MHVRNARVKAERVVAAAEGPQMNVMHFLHAFDLQHSASDVFHSQIRRAALEKNVRGLAQDADAGPQNEQTDGEAEKGIDPTSAGRMDDERAAEDSDVRK